MLQATLPRVCAVVAIPNKLTALTSLTFDAFAKGLVDRFGQALPKRWRPRPDYQVAFANDRTYREFLQNLTPPAEIGTLADIMAISVKEFERKWLFGAPLPEGAPIDPSPGNGLPTNSGRDGSMAASKAP